MFWCALGAELPAFPVEKFAAGIGVATLVTEPRCLVPASQAVLAKPASDLGGEATPLAASDPIVEASRMARCRLLLCVGEATRPELVRPREPLVLFDVTDLLESGARSQLDVLPGIETVGVKIERLCGLAVPHEI